MKLHTLNSREADALLALIRAARAVGKSAACFRTYLEPGQTHSEIPNEELAALQRALDVIASRSVDDVLRIDPNNVKRTG